MSVLQDLLRGSSSGSGGGGASIGQLIETSAFAPTLANHRKGTAKHILSRAEFPDLHGAIGSIADNAFRFSELSDTSPGNAVDDATSNVLTLVHDDSGLTSDASGIVHAEGDTWFVRRGSNLYISTTGSEGPFTQCTGFAESDPGFYNRGIAYHDGYLVCLGTQNVVCNTTQGDYTAWTEYTLGGSAGLRNRQILFAKGYFFVVWLDDGSGGSYNVSWTNDPRFEANWQDFDTGFNLLGGTAWSPTNGSDWLAYFPDEDKVVLFATYNYTSQDRHYFEIWYIDDPATETVFTENTEHNGLWSYVSSNDNTLVIGAIFEQGGSVLGVLDIQGTPKVFVWPDITAAPSRVYSDADLQMPNFPVRASVLDIPAMLPDGGMLVSSVGIVYRYWFDGLNLRHGRTDQQDFVYDGTQTSWNNQQASYCWTYDPDNEMIITYFTPDATETQDLYRWGWPLYTYDVATHVAVPATPHADPDIIYQTRVA